MLKQALFAVGLSIAAIGSQAAQLDIIGGHTEQLQNNFGAIQNDLFDHNDYIGQDITVFHGSEINNAGVFLDESMDVTFEYLGSEAGNTNFAYEYRNFGNNHLSNKDYSWVNESSIGDTFTADHNGGFLNFAFYTVGEYTNTSHDKIVNGQGTTHQALSIAIFRESNTSLLFLFGDGYGDTDFDDMVVRASIAVSAVPIPAALPMFALGLAGFGFARRRTNKKA